MTPETNERFWRKVNRNGPTPTSRPELGPCWIWIAHTDYKGYGRFFVNGKNTRAHHFLTPDCPEGLVRDHLCDNRRCVRDSHIAYVTNAQNVLRGNGPSARHARATYCPHGHPYSGDNLYVSPRGQRFCMICNREKHRQSYAARKRGAL